MNYKAWQAAGLAMAFFGAACVVDAEGADKGKRKEMMEKYDADGDGELNREERETMRDEMKENREERGGGAPTVESLLKKYDEDGDEKLDADELKKMLKDQKARMAERGERGNRGRGNR